MLETSNLTKVYGNQVAVNNLNVAIEAGSFTALLGPNGAGKSTTIQMLIGLLRPTSGQVRYRKNIKLGVVFQNSVLDDRLTVQENLEIRAKQYREVEKGAIGRLTQQLGLTSFVNQPYGTLSGGQKRRVDIARALLQNPDILFLDEPTTGLDIQTRESIWQLLKQLQKENQMTVVLTTHYLDEADDADQIYIIDHGRIIAQGSADAIKERYARSFLRIVTQNRKALKEILSNYCAFDEVKKGEFILHPETTEQALTVLEIANMYIQQFEFRPGTMALPEGMAYLRTLTFEICLMNSYNLSPVVEITSPERAWAI